jgi:hypothetical protein
VDECEKGISPKFRVNGTKADVLRRVFAEGGAGATDFSPWGGSTIAVITLPLPVLWIWGQFFHTFFYEALQIENFIY